MAPTLDYQQLKKLNPCKDGLARIVELMGGQSGWKNPITAAEAKALGATFDDIVWAASVIALKDVDVERRLRLWLADCAARVLPIYERSFPDDSRVRNAIVAARQYARGEIDSVARHAAWAAAARAADGAARAAAGAARAAARAARAAARAARAAARAARAAAWAAATDSEAAGSAEKAWQFDRLVARLSDPEPEDWPLPAQG